MAVSENIYVKLSGLTGALMERTAERQIDHANLRATGWVLKGSKNAPTGEPAAKQVSTVDSSTVPTSVRAQAEAAGQQNDTTKASSRP